MGYDFKNLSPIDFEDLVGDLLSKKLGIDLSFFSKGKDGGIDLRYFEASDSQCVVQCKHYAGSTFADLKKAVKEERDKLTTLKPSRYILATSCNLTPKNKETLQELLAPHCLTPDDVLGAADLNHLLRENPEIERTHFKLWLSSTAVMERIIHADAMARSRFAKERFVEQAKRYVMSEAHRRVGDALRDDHVCLITGGPGIGKTMLANVVALEHTNAGYDLVIVSGDISEGWRFLDSGGHHFFLYDDFLGQGALAEKFAKNEESSLLDFMEACSKRTGKRLVLTTREYILKGAELTYEKLRRANLNERRCVVSLGDYGLRQRARILYNHLHFGEVGREHIDALCGSRHHWKVIRHDKYSPRVVEYMSNSKRLKAVPAAKYVERFMASLDDPTELWRDAFESQLDDAARDALLLLATLPKPVFMRSLREAHVSFVEHRQGVVDKVASGRELNRAVDELDGTFLETAHEQEHVVISNINPSVQDFLTAHLYRNLDLVEPLLMSAVFLEQFQWLLTVEQRQGNQKAIAEEGLRLARSAPQIAQRIWNAESCGLYRYRHGGFGKGLFSAVPRRVHLLTKLWRAVSESPNVREAVHDALLQLRTLPRTEIGRPDEVASVAEALAATEFCAGPGEEELFAAWNQVGWMSDDDIYWASYHAAAAKMLSSFSPRVSGEIRTQLAAKFREYLDDYARDEARGCDDAEQAEEAAKAMELTSEILGVDASDAIQYVRERAAELPDPKDSAIEVEAPEFSRDRDAADDTDAIDGWFRTL